MTKQDIVNTLYRDKEYDRIINNVINSNYRKISFDDLKQELYLILMEMDEDKILKAYTHKYLKYLFVKILTNNVKSNTSRYYYKYDKDKIENILSFRTNDHYDDFWNDDLNESLIEENIENLYDLDLAQYCKDNKLLTWYENEILCLYLGIGHYQHQDKMSMRKIEEEYNIDHISIYKTIKQIKNKILICYQSLQH